MLLLVVLLMSCRKETVSGPEKIYECVFTQNDASMEGLIDETERSLMEACLENRLTTKTEVENNLIGEWELVGHGEGWIPSYSQPCAYLNIEAGSLSFQFTNAFRDTLATYAWEVMEVNSGGSNYYWLKTTPDETGYLGFTTFCSDNIFLDATPSDGNMYLYRRME
ncbi:hypothetical protein CRP01_36005 [Flavilitoribacter nigricans DSM 23189 = NBRC 102662]|uniref:Uncharacterized protein n=2 Tax=Flavilitoribacter TaxID=2762562 RepID=A0A2D0MZS5_FLAN2|nr:hypothetical protein CRP01_36005 [Flavilitoribacter nigricans DSM 23189 = NBRC 102662]